MDPTLYYAAKTLHIIAFTAWMAGMFYLPRLYVYHVDATAGGELDTTLQTMERKLLRYIMNPAMILTWGIGLWLAVMTDSFTQLWFHIKMLTVIAMSATHGMCAAYRKQFANGTNTKSSRYFRIFNEVPTILLIIIVSMAIFKPV